MSSSAGYDLPGPPISPVIKHSKYFEVHNPCSPLKEVNHSLRYRSSDYRSRGDDDKKKQTVV